jgi:stage II sporulation protein D
MARRIALILALLLAPVSAQTVRVKLSGQPRPVTMELEDYVAAVIAGEAGGFKSMEALKAMAIAARTFARSNLGRHRAQGYDLCETTHCQDLRLSAVNARHRAAAEATSGVILWYNGRPARVFYTEHCGGHTENAAHVWTTRSLPYLRGVKDDFCLSAGRQNWKTSYTLAQLAETLSLPTLDSIDIARRSETGRVRSLLINGRPVSAENFYLRLGRAFGWDRFRSKFFSLELRANEVHFSGWGRGHGVGLCQTGAEQRGLAGQDSTQILAAYFPGTKPGISAQDIHWVSSKTARIDILAAPSTPAAPLTAAAERALARAEQSTGLKSQVRPEIRAYPGLDVYRDATGEPGFVAAATRGRVIHLQSVARLISENRLEHVLTHEMLHVLIAARAPLPRWFHEGLVLELERPNAVPPAPLSAVTEMDLLRPRNEKRLRAAYTNAQAAVAGLIKKHGRAAVLGWISTGLPAAVSR